MSIGRSIRLGVFGAKRGAAFIAQAAACGFEVVAVCDQNEGACKKAAAGCGASHYVDFDCFIGHPGLEAIVLANYFHQHAPFAVRALRAGLHVISECLACATIGEGVELIDAVEASGCIYSFAENYPYMLANQEMRRLYQEGKVGSFVYGEGEYIHPMTAEDFIRHTPSADHWRTWLPATYYCTHALAPLMFIAEVWPESVSGFVMPAAADDPCWHRVPHTGDPASCIMVRMAGGAVVKLLQWNLRGHGNWVRVHGSRGLMEKLRHDDSGMVRLVREQWGETLDGPCEQTYLPRWPEAGEQATRAGHGGGDFFTLWHFGQAIRSGRQPFFDVFRGVAMSLVGIQAYRSALDNSALVRVPDLRERKQRDLYRHDHWSPDPARRQSGQPWPSVRGEIIPTSDQIDHARHLLSVDR